MRALHAILALLGFFAAARGVRAWVPWPEEYGLRSKLEWFGEHADEFDVLFVGSSRVFRGILPREFDAELARRGLTVRSFNLGVGGMQELEADRVLRWALAREPQRLAWVVVEAGRFDPRPDEFANTLTLRTVAWHDVAGTRNALEAAWALDVPLRERGGEALRHVRLFASWLANLGQGPEFVRAWRGTTRYADDPRRLSAAELERDGGWQELGAEGEHPAPDVWQRLVQRAAQSETRGTNPGPDALRHFPAGAVRRQIARVEASGARIVHASLPSSEGSVFARALAAQGILPRYLAYDLPSRYPRLYAAELRADPNHLNGEGARELTRLLAEDFARLAAQSP